jgi:hypothetical protein
MWAIKGRAVWDSDGATREAATAILERELVRDALYPGITREQWRRLDRTRALRAGRVDAEIFVHKLRLAKAAGSSTGRL